jgi:hypothetical protein
MILPNLLSLAFSGGAPGLDFKWLTNALNASNQNHFIIINDYSTLNGRSC